MDVQAEDLTDILRELTYLNAFIRVCMLQTIPRKLCSLSHRRKFSEFTGPATLFAARSSSGWSHDGWLLYSRRHCETHSA